jgi:hypothetical protein
MDVQAYFEEWSRLPGETVRMAISSRHESVRATLERITRGPTKEDTDGAFRSFGVPIPGVDITVPGVEQPTAIGSCAELPLGGAFGPSFALHFWFYSSVLKAFREQRPFVKPELFSTARLRPSTSFSWRPARSVQSVLR